MTFSMAVTAYQESERGTFSWIKEAIAPAVESPHVAEIVISDDASDDYDGLKHALTNIPKVRLIRNETNRGVFGNKLEAILSCESEWVLNWDSDNLLSLEYIDLLVRASVPLAPELLYCPSYGRPALDYRNVVGIWWLMDVESLSKAPQFGCLVNTGGWLVNRARFASIFERYRGMRFDLMQRNYLNVADRSDLWHRRAYDAVDSFFYMKEWWLSGGRVFIVPGLEYEHRVGFKSSWQRAPPEKDLLPAFYLAELLEAAKQRAYRRKKAAERCQ
jgi:glycosyltransferase involved in cell wall biosynthesis